MEDNYVPSFGINNNKVDKIEEMITWDVLNICKRSYVLGSRPNIPESSIGIAGLSEIR